MKRTMRTLAIAASLLLGPAVLAAWGQTENPNQAGNGPSGAAPAEESSGGDPLYGYVGTAFLCAGVIFVVCKSARR
jgi:hypothetical protein